MPHGALTTLGKARQAPFPISPVSTAGQSAVLDAASPFLPPSLSTLARAFTVDSPSLLLAWMLLHCNLRRTKYCKSLVPTDLVHMSYLVTLMQAPSPMTGEWFRLKCVSAMCK